MECILNKDIVIFEGEHKNGIKNGKGKEYDYDGTLMFEGEYLNGKRWKGKRTIYYYSSHLYFEGSILNREIEGKGKEYYSNGELRFIGEIHDGYRWNGKGYDKNGKMEFEIKDGKKKGKIYNIDIYITYKWEFLNGRFNGKGKEYYYDKLIFEGEYLNDQRNGKGK